MGKPLRLPIERNVNLQARAGVEACPYRAYFFIGKPISKIYKFYAQGRTAVSARAYRIEQASQLNELFPARAGVEACPYRTFFQIGSPNTSIDKFSA